MNTIQQGQQIAQQAVWRARLDETIKGNLSDLVHASGQQIIATDTPDKREFTLQGGFWNIGSDARYLDKKHLLNAAQVEVRATQNEPVYLSAVQVKQHVVVPANKWVDVDFKHNPEAAVGQDGLKAALVLLTGDSTWYSATTTVSPAG